MNSELNKITKILIFLLILTILLWFDSSKAWVRNFENIKINQKIQLGNANQVIPDIHHSPFSQIPPPLLKIEDDKGNQYMMTLTKFPVFLDIKTLKSYQTNTQIEYIQPTDKDPSEIRFYPYGIFIQNNLLFWLNRSNKKLLIDQYSLKYIENKLTKIGQLQFSKMKRYDVGSIIDYELDKFITADIFNNILIIANNQKIMAFELDKLTILWKKEFSKEWKIGPLKQIDNKLLVFELVNIESLPLSKNVIIKGMNRITGEELWQNESLSFSMHMIPIFYSFDNSVLLVELNQQINGFIGIYSDWVIKVFSNSGQLIRATQLPKQNKDVGLMMSINWLPLTYNSDFSILNNTIFLCFAGSESVEMVAYDFKSDSFRSAQKKLVTNDETTWLNPFLLQNEILLLESVAPNTERRTFGKIYKIKPISYSDPLLLSIIHVFEINLSYTSNPIPITNNHFAFLTDTTLYVCELVIKLH